MSEIEIIGHAAIYEYRSSGYIGGTSETSITTIRAISSGSPIRFSGIFSSKSFMFCGSLQTARLISVLIAPGATASTRTPWRATA